MSSALYWCAGLTEAGGVSGAIRIWGNSSSLAVMKSFGDLAAFLDILEGGPELAIFFKFFFESWVTRVAEGFAMLPLTMDPATTCWTTSFVHFSMPIGLSLALHERLW